MEDFTKQGTYYSPYKTEDKHYFGSYLNLAENNLKAIFHEFNERISNKSKDEDYFKIIDCKFFDKMSIVDYEKQIKILEDYLPIINLLDNKLENNKYIRIQYFKENLKFVLSLLNALRNYYTHYYHDPIKFDSDTDNVCTFLDKALFATIMDVKKKYLKSDKTKEILKDSLKEELEILSKTKIKDLEEKKRENSNFEFSRDPIQIKNSLYNEAFRGLLYENKKENTGTVLSNRGQSKLNEFDIHKEKDFEIPLSTSGLVFLLSMFLSKREIEDLKSNIKGFKGKVVKGDQDHNSLKYMATHRVYSILAFKGLKYRIKTEVFSKETLLMQMIDELSKVPDCIYKNLDENKRKDFIEDWNEYYKDNEENNENLQNSLVAHPVIRKRYEDKFNYFALRFLDEFANLPTLRFQVYVGDYLHDIRTKTIKNTTIISNRSIKEKINLFGRLSKIDNFKKDFFAKLNEDEKTCWEFFPNPSYNFLTQADSSLANNIPIYVELKNRNIIAEKEEIKKAIQLEENRKKRNSNKPTKKQILSEILNDCSEFTQGDPTAILSLNEIPALLHCFFIDPETGGVRVEKIIKDKIESQFNAIKNPTLENKNSIPKSLFNNSDGRVDFNKVLRDLELETLITNEKIENFQNQLFEAKNYHQDLKKYQFTPKAKRPLLRKHIFYNSEKGTEATWLANDIKRFMPDNFKENWKGYQHSELQRMIAFYDVTTKDDILALINECNFDASLFNIKGCFYKNTFEDFYFEYLSKRKKILGTLVGQLQTYKDDNRALKTIYKQCFIFLKKQNYVSVNTEKIKNRILAKPAFLPKGIFDDKPTIIKGKNPLYDKSDFAKWYIDFLENIDYQLFYNKNLYPTEQNFKMEAIIKKQKIKDYSSLQIVNFIMQKIFKKEEKLVLSELFQTRKKRLELEEIAKKQNNKSTGDRSVNVKNQKYIWNKEIEMSFFNNKVKIEEVKLKNIGKYRKIENDKRVKTFVEYEEDIDWLMYLPHNWKEKFDKKPINVVDIQLQEYEQIRSEQLLKEIQLFEKYIYDNITDKSAIQNNGNQNFKLYVLKGLFEQIKEVDTSSFQLLNGELKFDKLDFVKVHNCIIFEQKAIVLIAIRNKFAHNQLPSKEIYQLANTFIPKSNDESYASYYYRVTSLLTNELKT